MQPLVLVYLLLRWSAASQSRPRPGPHPDLDKLPSHLLRDIGLLEHSGRLDGEEEPTPSPVSQLSMGLLLMSIGPK